MNKYTPGPWIAIADDILGDSYIEPSVITSGDGPTRTVAVIRVGLEGTDANARLIAAAPDLLEACKAALEVSGEDCWYDHHGLCQEHNLRRNDKGEPECQVELLRKAIAKAEGKS